MNLILLQAAAKADPTGGMWSMPIMMGLMFVVVYFFMIRPQRQRKKEEEEMRKGLKKGDKIITAGGIHGKIINIDETTALIEVDTNTKLKMDKTFLRLVPDTTTEVAKS
jgi:preprotein translocase subunit YajC